MTTNDIRSHLERAAEAVERGNEKGRGNGRRQSLSMRFRWTTAYASYMLLAFPPHLILFILVVVLCAVGASLTVIFVGLPILYSGIMVARAGAVLQRGINRAFAGEKTSPPILRLFKRENAYDGFLYPTPGDMDWFRRLLYPLRDPQSWLDVLWVVGSFPITILNWCVALTWVAAILAGLTAPISLTIVENINESWNNGLGELLDIPHPFLFDVVSSFVFGLVALVSAPSVMKGLATLQLLFADVLLLRRARDRADIERLTRSREAGRRAESAALRRLERDLHDGPQQRLVRLNMDLARARRQAGSDPVRAQAILDEAMAQTRDTLAELRQLSRGIAPPVLVDRGLVAAVQEAAARSVVPVSVHAGIPAVPDHVASAAYYVVAESLVNVNKHAGASSVAVTIDVSGGVLRLSVVDDGVGGADVSKGHGLVGLEERLRSVDGTLEIDSPAGGPTTIEAVIPCAS